MADITSGSNMPEIPRWLESLLVEKFFNVCLIHENEKKNSRNVFCLDCCLSVCRHCVTYHEPHRLLQVRRYVYNDAILLEDAEKLMDCGLVQSYKANGIQVVYINKRPRARTLKSYDKNCITCGRSLQEEYQFCSLACKIDFVIKTEGEISKFLLECKVLTLPKDGAQDASFTIDSILEQDGSTTKTFSESTVDNEAALNASNTNSLTEGSSESTKAQAPEPAELAPSVPESHGPIVNYRKRKRKGTPRRSPFF